MRRIVVTPVSSASLVEPLFKHLVAQKQAFEEWHWWVATQDAGEVHRLKAMASQAPWIVWVQPEGCYPSPGNVSLFYELRQYTDPACMFLRLDERVSWLAPTLCDTMFAYRESAPTNVFLVHANAVGNPALAYLHDRFGALSSTAGSPAGMELGDGVATSAQFQADALAALATSIQRGTALEDWTFPSWKLDTHVLMPMDAFAWLGAEFQQFDGRVPMDEQLFLCRDRPVHVGRCSVVCGRALCALGGTFPAPTTTPPPTPGNPPSSPASPAVTFPFPPPLLAEVPPPPPAPRKRRTTRRSTAVNLA